MKSIAISLCILVRASCMSFSGVFQNLNFENVNTNNLEVLPKVFANGLIGPTHELLPGWNAPLACLVWRDKQQLVFPIGHDGMAGANVIVPGSINGFISLSSNLLEYFDNVSSYSRIVGDYGVVLASFNRDQFSEQGDLSDCACITQAGGLESHSKSIIYGSYSTPITVFLGSSKVNSFPLFFRSDKETGGQEIQYWGVDVSQLSGQEISVTFAGLGQLNQRSFHFLDDIRFSSESIDSLSARISMNVIEGGLWLDWGGRLSDEPNRRLQYSDSPIGPWETISDASNPYSATQFQRQSKFFRVIRNFPKD